MFKEVGCDDSLKKAKLFKIFLFKSRGEQEKEKRAKEENA